jgi:hypothetical protein
MYHLSSHWTDLSEIWYWKFFLKSAEKIQVGLKSDKMSGNLCACSIVASDIHLPGNSSLLVKCYQDVSVAEEG